MYVCTYMHTYLLISSLCAVHTGVNVGVFLHV